MAKKASKEEKNEVAEIQKDMTPILAQADKLEIEEAIDMAAAAEILSKLNLFSDRMTEEKEKVTKPANEILKAERARWKPLETVYEAAIAALRRKMTDYQTAIVAKQREDEARIAARVGEGKGKLKVETAIAQIEKLEKPAANVAAESGSVKFRAVKKFEVVDIALVPKDYVLANDAKIRAAMTAGIQIEGVRYYEEMVPANFR